jgi:hypothetical protein
VIAVRVINAGRGATSVLNVGIAYEGGAAFENPVAMDPPLPYRLDGEHEETWRFDGQQVTAYGKALTATQLGGQTIRGQVSVGGRDKPVVPENSTPCQLESWLWHQQPCQCHKPVEPRPIPSNQSRSAAGLKHRSSLQIRPFSASCSPACGPGGRGFEPVVWVGAGWPSAPITFGSQS